MLRPIKVQNIWKNIKCDFDNGSLKSVFILSLFHSKGLSFCTKTMETIDAKTY